MFPNYGFRAMLTKICVIWIISTLFAPSGISGNIICDSFKDEELTKARTAALERHNIYRCMHGAPPLVLDDEVRNKEDEPIHFNLFVRKCIYNSFVLSF